MIIKMCGFKNPDDIKYLSSIKVNMVGLVFYKKSPRHISFNKVEKLISLLPKKITPVAVVVNEEVNKIQILKNLGINTFQLHGEETPEHCKYLSERFSIRIIKAISVLKKDDILRAKKYKDVCDWILFDAKAKVNEMPGGNGKSFNWKLLDAVEHKYRWILSGGLSIDNVKTAISLSNAKAVDVSSGIEKISGKKDKILMTNFSKEVLSY